MHAFVTSIVSFDANRCDAVEARLGELDNPATSSVAIKLNALAIIHFLSITVVRSVPPPAQPPSGGPAHLIFEINADGAEASVIAALCSAIGDTLSALLGVAGSQIPQSGLSDFFLERCVAVGQGWFSTPGLLFDGTPGMTVERIRREADLAAYASDLVQRQPITQGALKTLQDIRSVLWNDGDWKWAFVAEPAPIVSAGPAITKIGVSTPAELLGGLYVLPRVVLSLFANFLWPSLFLPLALAALSLWGLERSLLQNWWGHGWTLPDILWSASAFLLGLLVGVAAFVLGLTAELVPAFLLIYWRLGGLEKTDRPEDVAPDPNLVAEIMKRENFAAQNHMATASTMKPGRLRRATLRFGLWAAGQIARYFSRPGFLASTGEIHFARWLLLPGTDKLLFFSNYDGGWESYLEDFIERSAQGVSGIWSNTIGFPKTASLFFKGAEDGNRLRRWTRRQQRPSLFWYSGYPTLTQDRIRLNAAIRQGLANARSEADAQDWLSCFGSAPRAADGLQIEQIPTLVFGGLRRLPFARCLLLTLNKQTAANKAWLQEVAPQVSYGNSYVRGATGLEGNDAKRALVVGYTRSGLEKLGMRQPLETFPTAFVQGSSAPWRARPLGDVVDNAPGTWLWGGPQTPIDAILLMYGRDADELERLCEDQKAALRRHGLNPSRELTLDEVEQKGLVREKFGFVDGISDPVMRGVGAWTDAAKRDHLVEPGEFVLGYPDGSGKLPNSPKVPASDDPHAILPAAPPFDPDRQRPDFASPKPVGAHDLGLNGTYLVVRQLEQDVDEFGRYCAGFGSHSELIAAKMIGRWKSGASLVRYPLHPSQYAKPDNDFRFGAEDADGRRCPLGAHIRRANPRDHFDPDSEVQISITNRHRILRVGRSYSPQDGRQKPGLLFMCLNSDIERQFEFLQQTWLLGSSFSGLEGEVDPLLGQGRAHMLTLPTDSGPRRLPAMRDFVRVLGSGYFFLPGKQAMTYLAE